MVRIVSILLLVCWSFLGFSQKDTNRVLHYKVKANSIQYRIFPADNYLFVGCRNKIKITVIGNSKIADVKVTNGTITKTSIDSVYVIKDLVAGSCLLTIYNLGKDGKKHPVHDKEYVVVDYPRLEFNGSKCDSSITRLMLNGGGFYAHYEKDIGRIPVSGFCMEMDEGGKVVIDSSTSYRVSKKMRTYIANAKPGTVLYLRNVTYEKADGSKKVEPFFRLFLGDDEPRPWGF